MLKEFPIANLSTTQIDIKNRPNKGSMDISKNHNNYGSKWNSKWWPVRQVKIQPMILLMYKSDFQGITHKLFQLKLQVEINQVLQDSFPLNLKVDMQQVLPSPYKLSFQVQSLTVIPFMNLLFIQLMIHLNIQTMIQVIIQIITELVYCP